jgi:hypothetical protein
VVVVGTAQRKKILSHKMMSLAELLKKKEQWHTDRLLGMNSLKEAANEVWLESWNIGTREAIHC